MVVRVAKKEDGPKVVGVLRDGQQMLAARGVNQWQGAFPDEVDLLASIGTGTTYVMEDDTGECMGTFRLLVTPEPTYAVVRGGTWRYQAPYATIHKLAVASAFAGRGVGSKLFEAAAAQAWAQGFRVLRVDTHADNAVMRRLIMRQDFLPVGEITVEDGTPRLAFEKKLD